MKKEIFTGILSAALLLGGQSVFAGDSSDDKDKKAEEETSKMSKDETSTDEMKTDKAKADEAKADIVDTAVAAGTFATLAKALEAAELIETLKGEGPFTVFAPTDEAFAKIPEETLNAILADKEQLTKILIYHVVAGEVTAEAVAEMESAETVAGPEIMIDTSDGVKINDATVTQADIMTSNGIIHVIDTVLLPPEE